MTEPAPGRGRSAHRLPAILGLLAICLSLVPGSSPARAGQEPATQSSPVADAATSAPDWGVLARPPVPPARVSSDPVVNSRVAAVGTAATEQGAAGALERAGALGLQVERGRLRLVVETSDFAAAMRGIAALGIVVEASADGLIQVLVAPGRIDELGAVPGVSRVRAPLPHAADAVVGQGVATINADAWHAAGIMGAGVKVAVIDLGFAGLADAVTAGDLGSVTSVDDCSGGFATGTKHGTAVAEIVHEVAPAAQLYLICIDTEVELANAVAYAKANGISVINHSVSWFNTSRGDGSGGPGSPEATAADATAAGILWVNAAGNEAQTHWSGTFADGDGSGWHQFASGNYGNGFYADAGDTVCGFLKWDDWPRSAQDFDLFILAADGTVLASSQNVQLGSQAPTEATCFTNDGAAGVFFMGIYRYSASRAPRMDLFVSGAGSIQYPVAAGSVTEPGSAPVVLSAGAVCWQATGVEPFSSRGPTIDGRFKPDLAGPDQVSTTTYGAFTTCGATSGFPGTSAASPHVAGAAALVMAAHPAYSVAQVKAFLKSSAVDLGDPGADSSFGAGLVRLPALPAVTVRLASSQNPSPEGASVVLTATVTPASATGTVTFRDVTAGGSIDLGTGAVDAGVATLTTALGIPGIRSLVAEYGGDGANPAAMSDPLVQRVIAASLTATETSLVLAPNPVGTGTPSTFTATVSPNPGTGSITWTVDGVVTETTPVESDGTSSVTRTYSAVGTHTIVAAFTEGTLFDASTSPEQVLTVYLGSSVALAASTATAVSGETLVTFTATMGDPDADGSITFRDTVGATTTDLATVVLAPGDAGDLVASVTVRLYPTGPHAIVAVYGGNATYGPGTSVPVRIQVTADVGVTASGVGVQYATFYPYKDGYRDTVSLRGTPGEPVSVTIRVYSGSGRLVRSWNLATRSGAWSVAWNGRTASGTLLAAGRYKVVQTLRDVPGHTRAITSYTTVSRKRLYWYTGTITRYGNQRAYASYSDYGYVYASSRYYRGVTLYGDTYPHWAWVGYNFTLKPATTYGTLTFKVLGTPRAGYGVPYTSFMNFGGGYEDGERWIGRSYAWYSTSVSSTGHVTSSRGVRAFVTVMGDNRGWYDVAKVRLTYRYALLR